MIKNRNSVIAVSLTVGLAAVMLWAALGTKGVSGPVQDPAKVAVPADGSDMSAPISKYLGRAPYFIVYDLKRDVFWSVSNPFAGEQHAAGLRAATMLIKKGVGVVVAQNVGPEPCKTFNNSGIEIYVGGSGTVRDGIRQYKAGSLIRTTKPNVPTHYGLPGQKPCPSILGQPKARIENPMRQVAWAGKMQENSWMIACPNCSITFAITHHGLALPESLVCPECKSRMPLAGPSDGGGTGTVGSGGVFR